MGHTLSMVDLGIPLLRNSERSDFKSCQKKHDWRWNQGLVPAMARTDARWFGTGWHLVWANYYTPPAGKDGFTRGRDPHDTWDEFTKGAYSFVSATEYWGESEEKEWHDSLSLGHIMIDGYLSTYKGDPSWEVLMPEQRFSANIPYTRGQSSKVAVWLERGVFTDPKFITRMVGTFDMPIRDHGQEGTPVKVVDHKTTGKKENVKFLVKDDQGGTYISVSTGYLRRAKLIGPTEAVAGAIWNYSRKGKPPDPTTTDDLGRVRNKPIKKHYIAALLNVSVDGLESLNDAQNEAAVALNKLTVPKLEAQANDRGITTVLGDVSMKQPGPLFWREPVERGKFNRLRQIERIAEDAEQIAMIRAGVMSPTKNPGEHCNWCDFSDLCDLDENGDDTEGYIEAVYRAEDPYADHRPGAKNSKI